MANDILNITGGATGTQTMGQSSVLTGGRGANFRLTLNTASVETSDIADITDKYDARFDDPRYYQGDAST